MSNDKKKILEDVGYIHHNKIPREKQVLSLVERKARARKYKGLRNKYQPVKKEARKNGE